MSRKNSANNILDSKLIWIIFSLITSILLWVYVTTVEGEEISLTFYGVDVEFSGEEILRDSTGYIITDVSSNTVSVELKGPRSVLSNIDAEDLSAIIDVSNTSRIGAVEKSYTINYASNISSNDISVVTHEPMTVSYYVDKEVSKTVELKGSFTGSVAEGYICEEFVFEPMNILVSGPSTEIDDIDYALVTVSRDELDKTINFESTFELMDITGNIVDSNTIEYETQTVDVTLPVLATKDVTLTVDIIEGGGATSKNAIITCTPAYVTLSGDASILDGVNNISVGTIDLSTFDPIINQKYSIIIPNNTENITGTSEAEVTVEIVGLSTTRKTTTKLDYIDLPDGYKAEIVSQNLEVVLRGSDESLASVSSNNIRVVASLADVTTIGTMAVPVEIYVDGYSDVGAVGEYRIYVEISK